ncbi:putative lipoprotein [Brucella grignonensis]|uniref:Putative lipoprotein n=1 Tax=Brucella grignonensis TaxID=94627 RepID=A0A256F8R5_9HYPH|nr:putative lipoprotein [Brucella grignonensis]
MWLQSLFSKKIVSAAAAASEARCDQNQRPASRLLAGPSFLKLVVC